MNILLIGSGAREHAIARAVKRSSQNHKLVCIGTNNNPGIMSLSSIFTVGKVTDCNVIVTFAKEHNVDLAIIGPEAPLETGLSDALWSANIPTVGPKKELAQIEISKAFARKLLTKYQIPVCPQFRVFTQMKGVKKFLQELGRNYVVKADGLMGGKGVKVSGEHLFSHEEARGYCEKLLVKDGQFVLEEKLIGEEFSLMSFCDGKNLAHMPPVQDHKRAYVGDEGPNTGGMGSYSDANHLLPFLTEDDVMQAQQFNEATIEALKKEFGMGYKGILYGGFIVTTDGIKLIEYNARLGDPEAMNVLAILESDLVTICLAIVDGTLTQEHARFSNLATVCKYAVPEGYPDSPVKGEKIDISEVEEKTQLYYASVESRGDELFEAGSRTVAYIGIAETLTEAETKAEEEISRVRGPLFHRTDIGTEELVQKRVDHMRELRCR